MVFEYGIGMHSPQAILRLYANQLDSTELEIDSLGNAGGFSGAAIWRVSTGEQAFCLRRWPSGVDVSRLRWQHAVLLDAHRRGCHFVSRPLLDARNQTLIETGGFAWQLEPWQTGRNDSGPCQSKKRRLSVIETVHRFQAAAAAFAQPVDDRAPTLVDRCARLRELLEGRFEAICRASHVAPSSLHRELLALLTDQFDRNAKTLLHQMEPLKSLHLPLQPVIRDVRCEHFFYDSNDRVCGLVDFGALRPDTRVADWVRLVTEFCRSADAIRSSIERVRQLTELSNEELAIFPSLYYSSILLAPINWLDWLYLQKRRFWDIRSISERLKSFSRQLRADEMKDAVNSSCEGLGL